jgi:hypothetical protein
MERNYRRVVCLRERVCHEKEAHFPSRRSRYQVVITLPELDPAFSSRQIVLAFLKNGKPLDDQGPYCIVIPEEKRMARWVRQVTKLKIVEVQ